MISHRLFIVLVLICCATLHTNYTHDTSAHLPTVHESQLSPQESWWDTLLNSPITRYGIPLVCAIAVYSTTNNNNIRLLAYFMCRDLMEGTFPYETSRIPGRLFIEKIVSDPKDKTLFENTIGQHAIPSIYAFYKKDTTKVAEEIGGVIGGATGIIISPLVWQKIGMDPYQMTMDPMRELCRFTGKQTGKWAYSATSQHFYQSPQ